jgi:hypothetical protein
MSHTRPGHTLAQKNFIFFLIVLKFPFAVFCQQADWFVLNDASHMFTPQFLEVDAAENSYVVGGYTGEAMFRSAQPEGKTFHTYTSEHWKKTFLAKYDASGEFQWLVKIRGTGSNSNYADPRAFRILSDGRLVLAAYTNSGITVEDLSSEKQKTKGYQQMQLLYFTAEGKFLSAQNVPIKHIMKLVEGPAGSLYMLGQKTGYNPNPRGIFVLKAGEKEIQRIPLPMIPINDFELHEGKLWFLTVEEKRTNRYQKRQTIGFYEVHEHNATVDWEPNFTLSLASYLDSRPSLIKTGNQVQLSLSLRKDKNALFQLNDEGKNLFDMQALLLYNSGGERIQLLDLNNLSASNLYIQGRKAGGYFWIAQPNGNFKVPGRDSIRINQSHPHERSQMILQFDEEMQVQNYLFGGAVSVHGPPCAIHEENERIFFSSRLFNRITIGDQTYELNWRSGFYLFKLSF